MRSAGDDGVVEPHAHPDEGADRSSDRGIETSRLSGGPRPPARGSAAPAFDLEPLPEPAPRPTAVPEPEHRPVDLELYEEPRQVAELLALRPRRRSLAEQLAREREDRRRRERQRRARIELERAERERIERERLERRRRLREERLRRDREALRRTRRRQATPRPRAEPALRLAPVGDPSPVPAVSAPRPTPAAGGGLVWPTTKAGFAVTVMVALAGALGSVLGLPVPGLDRATSDSALVSSATLFGVGAGTPPGLEDGHVFPIGGARPVDWGERPARFGAHRYGHTHEGQDLFAKPGTPLLAARDGVVIDGAGGKSFYAYGGGNAVVIYSPEEDRSYVYLHMRKPTRLRAGDRVQAGEVVGEVGCTGSCDGPHLHFEIRRGKVAYGHQGKPIDPAPHLRQWERFPASP